MGVRDVLADEVCVDGSGCGSSGAVSLPGGFVSSLLLPAARGYLCVIDAVLSFAKPYASKTSAVLSLAPMNALYERARSLALLREDEFGYTVRASATLRAGLGRLKRMALLVEKPSKRGKPSVVAVVDDQAYAHLCLVQALLVRVCGGEGGVMSRL